MQFENLPMSDGQGEVMYESPRKVKVAHGKFTDWFGPFEVHVYHFFLDQGKSRRFASPAQ